MRGDDTGPETERVCEVDSAFSDNLEVREFLGQGGVGRVFVGFERNLDRDVAIKEIIPEKLAQNREKKIARFVREARLAGRLQHPGVIPIYSLTKRDDGTYYYVMKRVQGKTLHAAISDCGSAEPLEAFRRRMGLLDHLIAVCEAMGYAHSQGVIHRDLKPSNIVLGEFGETIILDWGLARRIDEPEEKSGEETLSGDAELDADARLTRQGAILGTPAYLAPEQVDEECGAVDACTDVYTLGVILYMILCGHRPYAGNTREVLRQIIEDAPSPSPRARREFVPPALAAICEKAMSKDKTLRFRDASELASELRAYRDGRLVSVYAYSTGELIRRFVSRNKAAIAAAAAVMLSVVAGAGFSINFAIDAHRARQKAVGALVEVTNLSEAAMALARRKSARANSYFAELEAGMNSDAERLARSGIGDLGAVRSILETAAKRRPEAAGFYYVSLDAGTIASSSGSPKLPAEAAENEILYLRGLHGPEDGKSYEPRIHTLTDGRKAFAASVPVTRRGELAGGLVALMLPETAVPIMLKFDPRESDFQVWIMKDDGLLVYDEDASQIGRYLFTDEMYRDFPELLKFGDKIRGEPWGVGHYSFLGPDKRSVVYKVAAWDTLRSDGIEWKLVATHPYISE